MKYDKRIVESYYDQSDIPIPVFEYRFHPERKWRLDLAWPRFRVCMEVQGGIFIQGRHNRGAALLKEWEKLNALCCLGWRVLYVQPKDVCLAETVDMIRKAICVSLWAHYRQEEAEGGSVQ